MPDASESFPSYNDSAELERRAKAVAQNSVSVDKPIKNQAKKGFRFRVKRTNPKVRRRRWNPKRPDFL